MNKSKLVGYISFFTALILTVLLVPAHMFLGAETPGVGYAYQARGEETLLQFSAEGHVIGFGAKEVYLAHPEHALKVEFIGADPGLPLVESAKKADYGLPELGKVVYEKAWPGIDVTFSAVEGGIAESMYIIYPEGSPSDIVLGYNVPVEIMLCGGLRFEFANGYMTESAPIAWQEINGSKVPVVVQLSKQADSQVGFNLGSYDANYAVYIDPVYQWHTFHGGESIDYGRSIAVDAAGNIYITGSSNTSWTGPDGEAPLNPYAHHDGGQWVIFIVKLNSAGVYQWHTFYGSSGWDESYAIAVDADDNIYVTGHSQDSWDGPGGAVPLNSFEGHTYNIVVLKLDSAGAYQWHTFGGRGSGYGIVVDSANSVYVTGKRVCLTPGGAFVFKLNNSGDLQWYSIYGGEDLDKPPGERGNDSGKDIAVDSSGNVYVTGYSETPWDGPEETSPLNPHSGSWDLFVIKLNSFGVYQWHTFYGAGFDRGYGITVDSADHVYVTGCSEYSWEGPGGEPPLSNHSGSGEIVIIKLDSAGTYKWHTFCGGSSWDEGNSVTVDSYGNLYVAGYSHASWVGPGGEVPRNPHAGGRQDDIVVIKLDDTGTYKWHTFFGSLSWDAGGVGAFIDADTSGNVYVASSSGASWDGPGGAEPLNAHVGSESNLVVIKKSPDDPAIETLGDLPIGTKVVDKSWQWHFKTGFNYSGSGETKPVNWIVAAKNHYGGEPHVTLLSEDLIGRFRFDNSTDRGSNNGNNNWEYSGTGDASQGLRPWLNSTGLHAGEGFYNSFSDSFKSLIETRAVPTREWQTGDIYHTTDYVFTPNSTELGFSDPNPVGEAYQYFIINTQDADRVAQLGDEDTFYSMRSPSSTGFFSSAYIRRVTASGFMSNGVASDGNPGVRPALNLNSTARVSYNEEGIYEILSPLCSIQITIEPEEVRTAGAQWQFKEGPDTKWKDSGAIIDNLAPGTYSVTFKAVPGWNKPEDINIDLEEGESVERTGIYTKADPTWRNIAAADAQVLTFSDGVLAASVEGYGIGLYDEGWSNLTNVTARALAVDGSTLIASVEGFGIWFYNGEWNQLTPITAEFLAVDNGMIAASFTEHGIWLFDGITWANLTPAPARALAFDSGRLVASVDGFGTWLYDEQWLQLTPETAQHLAISGSNIAASFAGFGIWYYDGNDWINLTPAPARALALDNGILSASVDDFGTWLYDGEWNNILNLTADLLALDGGKVAASFEGQGVWLHE